MSVLPLIVPLFVLAILGWFVTKNAIWLPPGWSKGVNALTIRVFVPCLLFKGMYNHGLPNAHMGSVLLSFYIPLVALFWLLFFIQPSKQQRAPIALAGSFSNLVYVGIPVVTELFGEKALTYLFPIVAFHSLVLFSMYYLADALGSQGKTRWGTFLKPLKNPIVISLMLGLLANILAVPIPHIVMNTLEMPARAALPCALIAMGASLANISFKQAKWQILLILFAKLFMLPALVLLMSHYIFALPLLLSKILVVMASCPVGINAYVVVRSHGGDAPTVSSAILMSCWLSLFAWTFWLWLLGLSWFV